ncbi:MAG: hypothetical protein KGZ74_05460 [Chitinophagaceae bacterium]|nr:hypothetical protein [Chitinophagaceae bacterium]
MNRIFFIILLSIFSLCSMAQNDTLPKFTAKKKSGVITISWINAFKNASQINIQRSKDSNRNFVTIHSTPNPNAKTYSYIDKTAKNDTGYYRVFVLFEGTNYIFTRSQRAVEIKQEIVEKDPSVINVTGPEDVKSKDPKNREKIPPPVTNTPVKKAWEPSVFIYTGDDGNVVIKLPDAATKKYSVIFSREEGRPVFVISHVKQPYLTLDKATFLKSGWYFFELREDGNVKERNKFLITRDN